MTYVVIALIAFLAGIVLDEKLSGKIHDKLTAIHDEVLSVKAALTSKAKAVQTVAQEAKKIV